MELGLQLGLYMPTLGNIDDKCRGNPRKCLQECLAAWLRKEDKVTSKGGPTWTSLTTALDKIGEYKIASDIRRKSFIIITAIDSDIIGNYEVVKKVNN